MWKNYYVVNLTSEHQRLYWHILHTTENGSRGWTEVVPDLVRKPWEGSVAKLAQSYLQPTRHRDRVLHPTFLFF